MAYRQPDKRKEYRGRTEERNAGRGENKGNSRPVNRDAGQQEEAAYRRPRQERRESYRSVDSERDARRSGMERRTYRENFNPRVLGQRTNRPSEETRHPGGELRQDYRDFEYTQPPRKGSAAEEQEEDRILCGRNPIREALRSGRDIEKILVQKGELSGSARDIVATARNQKVMVQEVDKRRLDEIAPHHQGMIAFASAYAYTDVDDILQLAKERGEDPFIVILDGVTDPHNLGAIIRTAECAGAHGVIIPQHRSVGLTPAAVKASAGAIEHIKIARVTNLNRTIDDLKKSGIWTYAVTMKGKDFEKVDFHGGTALVIGAEGEGISRLAAEKCDLAVSLPMKGELDSLNASVAAAIVIYRVLCSRRKK